MPTKAPEERVVPPAKAYRWWVSWQAANAVIVTAATKEEAVALCRGLGYFGPAYIVPPRCKVVRATWRHLQLFDPEYNFVERRQRRLEEHPGHRWASAEVDQQLLIDSLPDALPELG